MATKTPTRLSANTFTARERRKLHALRRHYEQGRAKLRERVGVEHALALIGRWQGARARYCGTRKNPFDLRRCAVVHNHHAIEHLPAAQGA